MSFDILSFAFIHLQNRPRNSCGMEHPRTKSWTAPGREKNHCSNNQFCKSLLFPGILTFLLSWRLRLPLSWSHCRLLHPSQPVWDAGTVCLLLWTIQNMLHIPCIIYTGYLQVDFYLFKVSICRFWLSFKISPFPSCSNGYLFSGNIGPLGSC